MRSRRSARACSPTSRSRSQGGALDGLTAGHADPGRGAHARPVTRPPVPHVGQPGHRHLADLAGRDRASPATSPSTSPRRSRPRPRPTSRSSRPAMTSEETYVDQGLYWATGHRPMLKYVMRTYHPDLLLAGVPDHGRVPAPVPGPGLALAAERREEPGVRRRRPQRRSRRARVRARTVHPQGLHGGRRHAGPRAAPGRPGPRHVRLVRPRVRARSSSPSTPARCWSTSACCQRPRSPTAGRRRPRPSARPRPAGRAARCRSTSTWSGATRSTPRSGAGSAVEARTSTRPSPRSRPRTRASRTPTTGRMTASRRPGRSSTARSRRRSRGTSRTAPAAPPTWPIPTRTGDVVAFAFPPYQFDAATPGTLIAASHFFGQHGYVPDVQDLGRQRQHAGDVPRRRPRHRPRTGHGQDHRPRADAGLHPRHPRAPAEPGPRPDGDPAGWPLDQADLDRRHQRLPRPARPGNRRRRQQHQGPCGWGGLPGHDVR